MFDKHPIKLKFNRKFLFLFFFSIFVLGFVVTYFSFRFSGIFNKKLTTKTGVGEFSLAEPEPIDNSEKDIFNVLFLGYGGSNHSGGSLTDSIILISVNTVTKKYTLVSIPRDLWIQGNRKINAEASVNGYQGAISAVSSITGLPIHSYVAIDFENFIKMIDHLGGITVDIPGDFTDYFYPIAGLENEVCGFTENEINNFKAKYSGFELEKQFLCRYETISYKKGSVVVDGTSALKLARTRHADGDFARSARQFAILKGIAAKLISLRSVNKLNSTIDTLSNMVRTDLTLGKIKTLLEISGDTDTYISKDIHLTTENYLKEGRSPAGAYILYPKDGTFNYSDIEDFISPSISN